MLSHFYLTLQRYKKTFNSANFKRKKTLKSCFFTKKCILNSSFYAKNSLFIYIRIHLASRSDHLNPLTKNHIFFRENLRNSEKSYNFALANCKVYNQPTTFFLQNLKVLCIFFFVLMSGLG